MDPQSNVPPPVLPTQAPMPPQAPQAPTLASPPDLNQQTAQVQPPEAPVVETVDVVAQIVTAITDSKNVLVTVGTNPTVDELSALLGLTALLGKLSKHATAVFSGKVPAAMEFLDPEKTFEDTVDSLRDFIIALDKEKADKLRYKVEDDVVKIFITPYKTIISEKDLAFSQGDFNVDVVIALGVQKREAFDKAITAHGRILHDATVVAINTGSAKSNIGALDWNDDQASSISEMLVNLSDQLGNDMLDKQISTAFLTGIVAETNRFSNEKTNPKIMTMAAKLMAAGANQQLIATNLRQEGMLSESVRTKTKSTDHDDDGEMVLEHEPKPESESKSDSKKEDSPEKINVQVAQEEKIPLGSEPQPSDSESSKSEPLAPVEKERDDSKETGQPQDTDQASPEIKIPEPAEPVVTPEIISPPVIPPSVAPPMPPVSPESEAAALQTENQEPPLPIITPPTSRNAMTPPQFGGTLNATQLGGEDNGVLQQPSEPLTTLEHKNDGNIGSEEAIEAARKAVQDAAIDPPHKRLESIGTVPLPGGEDEPIITRNETPPNINELQPSQNSDVAPAALPSFVSETPEPSPVDAFMQPHTPAAASELTSGFSDPQILPPISMPPSLPTEPSSTAQAGSFPPLPPIPVPGSNGAMPPLPPLPGQATDPTANFQPQTSPEFMQNMPQSQNSWTQAGDQLASQQAQADADRQARIDDKVADYEKTVDRQRELNGLPPLNNPNGSGLPPLPPAR